MPPVSPTIIIFLRANALPYSECQICTVCASVRRRRRGIPIFEFAPFWHSRRDLHTRSHCDNDAPSVLVVRPLTFSGLMTLILSCCSSCIFHDSTLGLQIKPVLSPVKQYVSLCATTDSRHSLLSATCTRSCCSVNGQATNTCGSGPCTRRTEVQGQWDSGVS